ncbi:MAG: PHP domain-containing protein [Halobacteriaceae archaeon]
MADYHIHSTYSDGALIARMLAAADTADATAVGFADHSIVSDRDPPRDRRARRGFNLDRTHERRRIAIDRFREEVDLTVYDAVEIDYAPADEPAIEEYLETTPFDYAIGSVHAIDGLDVQDTDAIAALTDPERRRVVETYFDRLVAMIESELVAVAAHPDLVERTEPLRGIADRTQYERVAAAFAESRTVPEINAGRVHRGFGRVHPTAAFLAVLEDHDVEMTVGSDAHRPDELRDRHDHLATFLESNGIAPVAPDPVR